MTHLIRFLRDPIFYLPFSFLILFELFLQSGLYKNFLQPRSYADNVNNIIKKTEQSHIKPTVLILGTSVAYQGIQVRQLNETLNSHGISALSGACEGAKLITQHSIFKALRPSLPSLRTVIHVTETTFPGTARYGIDEPNISMLSQFPRNQVLPLIEDYDFKLSTRDLLHFYIRSVTYQKDMRDFVLDPLDRIKGVSRRFREPFSDYVYENSSDFRISAYPAKSLQECVKIAEKGVPEIGSDGVQITDNHHRHAVRTTCALAQRDTMAIPGQKQWNQLFFKRLNLFYTDIKKEGLQIITVFPPFSTLIHDPNSDNKMRLWHDNLKAIHGNDKFYTIDLRHSLDKTNNGDLFYDTIHLNRPGSIQFTEKLTEQLLLLSKNTDIFKKQDIQKQ